MRFQIVRPAFWFASFGFTVAMTFMNVGQVQSASSQQLDAASGGACYECLDQDYCELQEPCHPIKDSKGKPTGFHRKLEGTSITQWFCYDRAANKAPGKGKKNCSTGTPQDCVKTYTCTDAACNNCGLPGTEKKDTVCTASGAACEVKD